MKAELKDSDIIELHKDGCTNIEMAEILGVTIWAIGYRLKRMGLERNPTHRRFCKQFAAYKNGELVAKGTAWEVSVKCGLSESTIRNYARHTKNGDKNVSLKIYEVEE